MLRVPPNTVTIDNFSFAPATLMVKAGSTVTWMNRDDIPHGIAFDSYSFTFATPGTYQYFCYLHPHMVGSIVVEATTGSTT
jgi:plastocyanin